MMLREFFCSDYEVQGWTRIQQVDSDGEVTVLHKGCAEEIDWLKLRGIEEREVTYVFTAMEFIQEIVVEIEEGE